MRRTLAITALAVMLLLPASGLALYPPPPKSNAVVQAPQNYQAVIPLPQQPGPSTQSCENPVIIDNSKTVKMWVADIQNRLNTYTTAPIVNGYYEICFKVELPNGFVIKPNTLGPYFGGTPIGEFNGIFTVFVNSNETKDVHIVGLDIIIDDTMYTQPVGNPPHMYTGPILQVINASTKGAKVFLEGLRLSNVKDGLSLEGLGEVVVRKYIGSNSLPAAETTITGDAQKSGSCITVKSPGAKLDKVTAKNCAEGVKIQADSVSIVNKSEVIGNKIGVHVHDSFEGTDIQNSIIFGNDDGDMSNMRRSDGVKIDAGIPHAPAFYDKIGDKPSEVADSEDPYDFENRPAYLHVQIPDGETRPAVIEIMTSDDIYKQANDLIKETNVSPVQYLRKKIDPVQLKQGPIKIDIPPDAYNKKLIVIYTDPELGTAGISRQFMKEGGIVAIVATPYDIPTTSGVSGSGGDDDDSGADTSGVSSAGIGGDGGGEVTAVAANPENITDMVDASAGAGAGTGMKSCALITTPHHNTSKALGILWLLLVLGVLTTLRPAKARVRVRKK